MVIGLGLGAELFAPGVLGSPVFLLLLGLYQPVFYTTACLAGCRQARWRLATGGRKWLALGNRLLEHALSGKWSSYPWSGREPILANSAGPCPTLEHGTALSECHCAPPPHCKTSGLLFPQQFWEIPDGKKKLFPPGDVLQIFPTPLAVLRLTCRHSRLPCPGKGEQVPRRSGSLPLRPPNFQALLAM